MGTAGQWVKRQVQGAEETPAAAIHRGRLTWQRRGRPQHECCLRCARVLARVNAKDVSESQRASTISQDLAGESEEVFFSLTRENLQAQV